MRIFLSIDVPAELAGHFVSLQQQLVHPSLKATDHYHITLAFFGDVSMAEFVEIKTGLESVHADGFTLKTGTALGCFSNWNRLRVLFVPVEYHKTLNQIAMKLYSLFGKKYNLGNEFSPHVTLSRVKQEIRDPPYVSHLQQITFEPLSWRVTELVLYESILLPQGPEYKRIGSVKLS